MVTASSLAASASCSSPRPPSRTARLFSELARSGRKTSGRAAASSGRFGWLPRSRPARPSGRPRPAGRQVVQRPGEAVGGVRFCVEGVCPVLGDLLAGGGERGELHAVFGHLVGERGGEAGLGASCRARRAGLRSRPAGASMAAVSRSGRCSSSRPPCPRTGRRVAGTGTVRICPACSGMVMLASPARTSSPGVCGFDH